MLVRFNRRSVDWITFELKDSGFDKSLGYTWIRSNSESIKSGFHLRTPPPQKKRKTHKKTPTTTTTTTHGN